MIALPRNLVLFGALLGLALAAFGSSVLACFHFDDFSLLSDPAVTSPSGWREVWRPAQTRPLTYFTFWLNYQLGGRNPVGYHVLNLTLHLATVALLFDVLSRMLPRRPALVAAALFALHPIQAEAVVYIFARGTLLATLFCLLALRFWLVGRHWGAVLWFAAALLAKEECVAFPLFLLLLHLASSRSLAELKPIGAMLCLSLAAGLRVMLVAAQVPASGAGPGSAVSPLDYLATQGIVILRYFRLWVLPWGFTVDPDVPIASGWKALAAWAAILGAAGVALRRFGRRREGFWFLAGLVLLAPSSSIFPADDLAADRRMYLPLVAFSAAAGLLLARLKPRLLWIPGLLLLVLSIGRAQVWRTERTLWEEAARLAPNKVRPKIRLSRVVDRKRGLELLLEAKSIAPDNALIAAELGRKYLLLGRPKQALPEFGRALALAPRDPLAFTGRGVALLLLGEQDAARQDLKRALALDPCLFDARYNLRLLGVHTQAPADCRYSPDQQKALEGGPAETVTEP